jgi:hypothetical protein
VLGEKIEEFPLRHEGNETAARRQMREIGERDALLADLTGELAHLLMRPLEKGIEQPKFVRNLKRRGVDGVAPEVAEEIGVFLQHRHVDAGAGEQKPEHHAGGSTPGDATDSGYCLGWHGSASGLLNLHDKIFLAASSFYASTEASR